jgi:hypothetical protein
MILACVRRVLFDTELHGEHREHRVLKEERGTVLLQFVIVVVVRW